MAMECLACFGERENAASCGYEAHAELGLQRGERRLSFEVCKPNAFAAAVYEPKSTTLAKK